MYTGCICWLKHIKSSPERTQDEVVSRESNRRTTHLAREGEGRGKGDGGGSSPRAAERGFEGKIESPCQINQVSRID